MLPLYFRYDASPPPPEVRLKTLFVLEWSRLSLLYPLENDSVTFMFTINEGAYSSVEQQLAGG